MGGGCSLLGSDTPSPAGAYIWMGVLGRLLKRWPLLPVQRVHDAFDLLDVRPFMACKPLRIKQHGPFE